MKIKKFFTWRVNLLLIVLLLMVLAISPNPWAEGVQIKNVEKGSVAEAQGLRAGEIIKTINNREITSLLDYNNIIKEETKVEPVSVKVKTDQGIFSYIVTNDIGFEVENLTITTVEEAVENVTGLKEGMIVKEINNKKINDTDEFYSVVDEIIQKSRLVIKTNKRSYAFLMAGEPEIRVGNAEKSNIKMGLDFRGGTRVLLKPESEEKITDKNIADLIAVLSNRLNIYGLTDLVIRPANDWQGNKFVLIEIAGATREEVKELMAKQGKFEAKIGNETVFVGGKGDVPYVCRGDGSCSGIRPPCTKLGEQQWSCRFEFAIKLSAEGADKHANITENLAINVTEEGREYLNETLDLYLDDKKVDSLLIGADLKGRAVTDIAISGPGVGRTEEEAYTNALENMDKLQTVLITGSLPLKLSIAKLDSISPVLGSRFIKNAFLAGIFALLAVAIVVFIRYRKLKITIPMVIISLSEVIIILGFAALIRWNLDLAAIAGIIAAVGTGVDDQILITDEVLKGEEKYYSWKQRVKRAFFIIMVAYATTFAAMIPLWNAGAGLVRGFAVTTIIGISVGVFLTRPAFASMIEKLLQ